MLATGRANVPRCLNVQVYQPDTAREEAERPALVLIGDSIGYWAPSRYILYIDDSAEPAMVRRMGSFLQSEYGINPQNSTRVRMKKSSSTRMRRLEIPGILSYDITATDQVTVSDEVRHYLYSWLRHPMQWTTKSVTYKAPSGQVEYKGTNSLVAGFEVAAGSADTSRSKHGPQLEACGRPSLRAVAK